MSGLPEATVTPHPDGGEEPPSMATAAPTVQAPSRPDTFIKTEPGSDNVEVAAPTKQPIKVEELSSPRGSNRRLSATAISEIADSDSGKSTATLVLPTPTKKKFTKQRTSNASVRSFPNGAKQPRSDSDSDDDSDVGNLLSDIPRQKMSAPSAGEWMALLSTSTNRLKAH